MSDSEKKDFKAAWSTSISNIVDQTQYAIDSVVEQIKKSQIDYMETINNYQDDVYLLAKNIIDRSIEMQKSFKIFHVSLSGGSRKTITLLVKSIKIFALLVMMNIENIEPDKELRNNIKTISWVT
jgi:hypothetical protein